MALIPSSSSTREWKYDVFVNFRGKDTRTTFTDHLYAGLEEKGISTFRDDEKLPRGKRIRSELLKAIGESRIAVVIFSRNYASSSWCLTELAEIVACMKRTGLVVLPVFHYVDPSDVRHQKGIYAEALKKHEEPFKDIKKEDVNMWKAALTEVGGISGWDLRNRHEAKVIREIVGMISDELNGKLNRRFSENFPEHFVGIDSRVEEMLDSYLSEGFGGVRSVGFCVMVGIVKTTLAQSILKHLIPQRCTKLYQIQASFRNLKLRIQLDLNGCKCLEILPPKISLESLEVFDLSGCSRLEKFPEILGNMSCLSKLDLSDSQKLIETLNFSGAPNLKYLILLHCTKLYKIHASLENLKWLIQLDLNGCKCLEILPPKISLESFEFSDLSGCSSLEKLPEIVGNMPCLAKLDLSDCQKLIETPDFSGVPNLKRLILRHCTKLYKIHASLGNLKWLIKLDLNGCKCLEILPPKMSLESLEVFDLSGCSRLKKFPEIVGNMSCLSKLDLDKTAIKELPASVQNLTNLTFLSLKDCKNLSSLGVCCSWIFLKTLTLSGCSKLKKFPEIVGNMSCLTELYLNETAIKELPSSVDHLIGLTFLSLRNCKNLSSLTDATCTLTSLKTLILSGCSKLDELPENLGNLKDLEVIDVSGTAIKALPSSVVHLKNLRVISLCRCDGLSSKSLNKLLGSLIFLCHL